MERKAQLLCSECVCCPSASLIPSFPLYFSFSCVVAEEEPPFGFLGPLTAIRGRSPLLPSLTYGLYTFVTASPPFPQLFFCTSALMLNHNGKRAQRSTESSVLKVQEGDLGTGGILSSFWGDAVSTEHTEHSCQESAPGPKGAPSSALHSWGSSCALLSFPASCCSVSTAPSALWPRKRKEVPNSSVSSPPAPLLPAHTATLRYSFIYKQIDVK